jgi:hypothetical protein
MKMRKQYGILLFTFLTVSTLWPEEQPTLFGRTRQFTARLKENCLRTIKRQYQDKHNRRWWLSSGAICLISFISWRWGAFQRILERGKLKSRSNSNASATTNADAPPAVSQKAKSLETVLGNPDISQEQSPNGTEESNENVTNWTKQAVPNRRTKTTKPEKKQGNWNFIGTEQNSSDEPLPREVRDTLRKQPDQIAHATRRGLVVKHRQSKSPSDATNKQNDPEVLRAAIKTVQEFCQPPQSKEVDKRKRWENARKAFGAHCARRQAAQGNAKRQDDDAPEEKGGADSPDSDGFDTGQNSVLVDPNIGTTQHEAVYYADGEEKRNVTPEEEAEAKEELDLITGASSTEDVVKRLGIDEALVVPLLRKYIQQGQSLKGAKKRVARSLQVKYYYIDSKLFESIIETAEQTILRQEDAQQQFDTGIKNADFDTILKALTNGATFKDNECLHKLIEVANHNGPLSKEQRSQFSTTIWQLVAREGQQLQKNDINIINKWTPRRKAAVWKVYPQNPPKSSIPIQEITP